MAERRNEAILGKVKRLFRIAYESADQPEYRGLMPVHDLCECRLPATERQRGKFTIGARLELQTHRASSRSEEHTSELQSLMRISYAVFCLKKKTPTKETTSTTH